nr:MAG TPA: C2H2 type zinc-finger protein [Caudoviricetes sp.]
MLFTHSQCSKTFSHRLLSQNTGCNMYPVL